MINLQIDADFESGNVDNVRVPEENRVDFDIRADRSSEHYQWFYFRVRGGRGRTIKFQATNGAGAAYSDGWRFHQPVISPDQKSWRRIENTGYDGQVFSFTTRIDSDPAYIAYYHPFTVADLEAYLARLGHHPHLHRKVLTSSVEGRPVHWLQVGAPEALESPEKSVWVIGRQHPGEPQGTCSALGLLSFLLGDSSEAQSLLKSCVFHIVPDINPDGVALGHHRTNALGVNLNRAWALDSPAKAPTIYAFQQALLQWKTDGRTVDVFLDMHSDEIARENVVYAINGEVTSPEYQQLQDKFLSLWQEENPDFSAEKSSAYASLDPRLARQWVYRATGALSYTFEMTYHDAPYSQYEGEYITPERTFELGAAAGRALGRLFAEGKA